jgi:hypothetical protein
VNRLLQRGFHIGFLLICSAFAAAQPHALASDEVNGVTAVAAKVSNDYVRAKLPDGSFQPEFYTFGEGGIWGGEIKDPTFEKLNFKQVAHIIAMPLASQKYLPASDPNKTKILIMVYWGTTAVPESTTTSSVVQTFGEASSALSQAMNPHNPEPKGAQNAAMSEWSSAMTLLNMENRLRDITDFKNAAMLGYDSTNLIGTEYGRYLAHTALGQEQRDEVAEIEENRYFVVLMAYDFQLMWKQKKHKLLWETRFSINERRNQFDKALPVMAQFASRYFGQDSNGLLRTRVPEGRVEVGAPKSLGEIPEK